MGKKRAPGACMLAEAKALAVVDESKRGQVIGIRNSDRSLCFAAMLLRSWSAADAI
jgi:hypothetical protein